MVGTSSSKNFSVTSDGVRCYDDLGIKMVREGKNMVFTSNKVVNNNSEGIRIINRDPYLGATHGHRRRK